MVVVVGGEGIDEKNPRHTIRLLRLMLADATRCQLPSFLCRAVLTCRIYRLGVVHIQKGKVNQVEYNL